MSNAFVFALFALAINFPVILCGPIDKDSSEKCKRLCPAILAQVCGTDGMTYDNKCHLEVKACKEQSDMTVKHTGKCKENDCQVSCPTAYRPICGSDGVTYSNKCNLEAAACHKEEDITIVNAGHCSSPLDIEAVEVEDNCPKFCSLIYLPVCGSDGKTYPNKCTLDVHNCHEGTSVEVVSDGKCEPLVEDQPAIDFDCPETESPVCATDGKTYKNKCLMLQEAADLTVDYDGPCIEAIESESGEGGDYNNNECNEWCTFEYDPTCASNGEIYPNPCYFLYHNCLAGGTLEKVDCDENSPN